MADTAENAKLDIEQLADFLAGRASPAVAGRLRRELANPEAEASELLLAFDEADGDPLDVDWSRLDEPLQNSSVLHRATAQRSSRPNLRHWMRTVAVGLASGLATVAFLCAVDGKWSAIFPAGAPSGAQAVARPPRAIKLEAELAKAESLSPQTALQEAAETFEVNFVATDETASALPTVPQVAEVKLVGESRPTGLQMREHLAFFGIGSP